MCSLKDISVNVWIAHSCGRIWWPPHYRHTSVAWRSLPGTSSWTTRTLRSFWVPTTITRNENRVEDQNRPSGSGMRLRAYAGNENPFYRPDMKHHYVNIQYYTSLPYWMCINNFFSLYTRTYTHDMTNADFSPQTGKVRYQCPLYPCCSTSNI